MVKRIVSSLGIEAWLVEDYAVPIIALDFAFAGGASQDAPDRTGIGRMMAALLDEGAGPLDDRTYQERLEENAVEISFHAGRDHITGSLRTLANKREAAFDLLRLALAEPRFDPDPVERIRQAVLAGLRRETADPNAIASKAFSARLFPDHPYGWWVAGDAESVAAITRDEIAAQHRRLFAKDGLVVSIVGAIDEVDAAAALDAIFGALPTTALLQPVADVGLAGLGTRHVVDLDVPQTVLQFATPSVKRADPRFQAAYIANHILGGGSFSCRLFQKVREEKGLAYSVATHLASFAHAAFVGGSVATRNDRAAESLAIIEEQMADIAAAGPTEEEVESAKKYLTGSYALRFDTSSKIANQLTQIQIEKLGIDYMQRRNAEVMAVTMDEVKAASAFLFGEGKPLVLAVGRPQGL